MENEVLHYNYLTHMYTRDCMPNIENTEAKEQYNNELVPLQKILEIT